MAKTLNLLDDNGWYEFNKTIQLFRGSFLQSGGDPKDFPTFLEENGILADGFLIIVDDRASALEQLLKD